MEFTIQQSKLKIENKVMNIFRVRTIFIPDLLNIN